MTEVQQVLAAIDDNPGQTIEEVAASTGLGFSTVRLIVDELRRTPVVDDDYDGHLSVTQIGDEVMMTRGEAAKED